MLQGNNIWAYLWYLRISGFRGEHINKLDATLNHERGQPLNHSHFFNMAITTAIGIKTHPKNKATANLRP